MKIAGFELTYDSGNTIQPSQKIMIKHNTVPYSETEKQNFLFAAVKNMINPLQLFIFTNVIPCSRLTLWGGYFIYFIFTHVSSIVYQWLHL